MSPTTFARRFVAATEPPRTSGYSASAFSPLNGSFAMHLMTGARPDPTRRRP
jgi:hypothetical protein